MKKNRLSILMLAPTPYFSDRGCHVRIYEEARELQRRGHRVHVVTYHLGRDIGDIPVIRIPTVPWYRKRTAGPSWHKPYLDLMLLWTAWKTVRRVQPDVIHAHLHEGAFIGFFLKKLFRLPLIFDCQGSLTAELRDHGFTRPESFLDRAFGFMERRINRLADHIITSSTPTADLLRNDYGLSAGRVTAVVDGVDTQTFRPQKGDTNALRRKLGVPEEKKIAVFLGAMTEYQGLDLLIDVVKRIGERREDLHFLIMGYPEEGYREKARKKEIADLITFTGQIDYEKAPDFLSLGDIALSPKLSRTEANGKLFDYMACGLPTVVFDTPVNREILGDLGLYAEYNNADNFAAKIEEVFDHSVHLSELPHQLRERAQRVHSWKLRGDAIEEIYRKLMQ